MPRAPKPRPIAIMIGQLSQGGSERQLYTFLSRTNRLDWDPTLFVAGELGYWQGPIRDLGVRTHLLTGSPIHKVALFGYEARRRKFDAFFSWSSYTNVYALALKGSRTRCIGSFRNAGFSDLPETFRPVWSWASLSNLSTVVCNSVETMQFLRRFIRPRQQLECVFNAVESPTRPEIARMRRYWRYELGLDDDECLVLGVGRLARQKRFDRFIEVIRHAGETSRMRACIVGADSGCRNRLESMIAEYGMAEKIRLLGSVPDAREVMCAADIFLLCSEHEGMPNVVLEAMAAGVACVSTKVNGVSSLITNGVSGFVCGHDVSELAGAISRLASDKALREAIGKRAQEMIHTHHNPETVARELWALCEAGR